jgi:hypothetical protein
MPKLHELIGPCFQLGFIKPATERLEVDIHVIRPDVNRPEKFRGF